jgi:hypothetical protein
MANLSKYLLAIILCSDCQAHDGLTDREIWGGDSLGRHVVSVRIPPEIRQRNAGGSDGAGLCVIASSVTAGRYQHVPGIDRLWESAKQLPGGYYPEKFDILARSVLPEEKYTHYTGTSTAAIERWLAAGYPVSATMNTGKLYGWDRIHHFVNVVKLDKQNNLAAIVDNNKPEITAWMSAQDYERRFIDGGTGWALAWERKPRSLNPIFGWMAAALGALVAVLAKLGTETNECE